MAHRSPASATPAVDRGSGVTAWTRTELAAAFPARDDGAVGLGRRIERAGLLAGDGAHLASAHARLCAEGTTPQAAATYLVEWFAGSAAATVGLGLASGAGVLLEADRVRWRLAAGGEPEAVELDRPAAAVPPGHAWVGTLGVQVLAGPGAVRAAAVAALVEFLAPVVTACRRLARVNTRALWDEVADGLGTVLATRHAGPVTPVMLDELRAALAVPGAPWWRVPRLSWARSEMLGDLHVAQKGGCCLAFTNPPDPGVEPDPADLDAEARAYRQRFPPDPSGKRYCGTCRFRDPADCDARAVFQAERRTLAGRDG